MKPLSVWRPLHWHNRCPLAAVVMLLNTTSPLRAAEVVAWGDNAYGQINVPSEATNVVAVAAGLHHSLALRADGTVVAWGWNARRQTDVPLGLSRVVAVAGGGAHSLALRGDGTVVAWGSNDEGQLDVPVGLSNVVNVVGGSRHSLALRQDGSVVGWGGPYRSAPGALPGVSNVVALAASLGDGATLSWLRADGTVEGEYSDWRICGDDTAACLTNILALAEGSWRSVALRADGRVLTSGGGQVRDLTNAVAVAAGREGNLALRSDGMVVAWGPSGQARVLAGLSNVVGIASGWLHRLALIGQGPPLLPPPLPRRTVGTSASAGFLVWAAGAWPLNYQWQFNGADLPGATAPALLLTNAQPEQAGLYSVCVSNGWGMATSQGAELVILPLMIRVPPVPQVGFPGGRARFTVRAVGNGPLAYQWRLNGANVPGATLDTLVLDHLQFSQVGDYSVAVRNPLGEAVSGAARLDLSMVVAWSCDLARGVPSGLSNIIAVAAGEEDSVILRRDGTVSAWGDNSSMYGNLHPPAGLRNIVAVAAGVDFGLALTDQGRVVGWGQEYDLEDYPVPPGLSNVVAIDAGQIGLALRADGTVAAWGEYPVGFVGDFARPPLWLSNVIQVAAASSHRPGVAHHLALRADGIVVAFGSDGARQDDTQVAV